MSSDPRFSAGPTIIDDMREVKRRLSLLEANRGGFLGSGGPASFTALLTATGSSASDYTCSASPSAYETDTTLTVSVTPTADGSLLVLVDGTALCDTQRDDDGFALCAYLDTTEGGHTAQYAVPVANYRVAFAFQALFASVAAGAHTVKLRIKRVNTSDSVVIPWRRITVICIPE